ncbi:MAG: c-type cytochrome [Sulfuritalea sp.]|nr:c-type cytochrome [Sulfuritalea sp.]
MKRLNAILTLALLAGPAAAADGKTVYDNICYKCHRTGTDDAPRTGNKADWAPRLAQGTAALYKNVAEGKGAMDPRAGKPELSDAELKAGVDYLVGMVK